MKRAIVMLSGGLDSATVLAIARSEGYTVSALSFDYGQRHKDELAAAARVAEHQGVTDHRVVRIDLSAIGGSSLTDPSLEVPTHAPTEIGRGPIPTTYVPARNTVFLSIALGLAEATGARDLFFGANALDYSGYPDCRPEFVAAFEALANVATRDAVEKGARFKVHAPLIALTKAEIITRGTALGVDYGMTHSCYAPIAANACGRCDSCVLRARGFVDAGVPDPTVYADVDGSNGKR